MPLCTSKHLLNPPAPCAEETSRVPEPSKEEVHRFQFLCVWLLRFRLLKRLSRRAIAVGELSAQKLHECVARIR